MNLDNPFSVFDDGAVLVTGGTGSFGRRFVECVLCRSSARRVIVLSRDEFKQHQMQQELGRDAAGRMRFFLGDVRDRDRLHRAFDGVDFVIHAAALKQIPAAEYNPFEFVKTNILGSQNVIDAAIDRGVHRVVALSTDKASSPINLYGATKLVSDKLFVAGNAYSGSKATRFAVVRYGNVVGSRGSVIARLRGMNGNGMFPLTDSRMTRFWITLDQAVEFVAAVFRRMTGGEVFVPKLPSMRLVDVVAVLAPSARLETTGIRPGEKLHEEMISVDEARRAVDCGTFYVVRPEIDAADPQAIAGAPVPEGFRYCSDGNSDWLDPARLEALLNG